MNRSHFGTVPDRGIDRVTYLAAVLGRTLPDDRNGVRRRDRERRPQSGNSFSAMKKPAGSVEWPSRANRPHMPRGYPASLSSSVETAGQELSLDVDELRDLRRDDLHGVLGGVEAIP